MFVRIFQVGLADRTSPRRQAGRTGAGEDVAADGLDLVDQLVDGDGVDGCGAEDFTVGQAHGLCGRGEGYEQRKCHEPAGEQNWFHVFVLCWSYPLSNRTVAQKKSPVKARGGGRKLTGAVTGRLLGGTSIWIIAIRSSVSIK